MWLNSKYLPGIDISHHQNIVDWRLVKESGVAFAFLKATEGTDFLDPLFHNNWTDTRREVSLVARRHPAVQVVGQRLKIRVAWKSGPFVGTHYAPGAVPAGVDRGSRLVHIVLELLVTPDPTQSRCLVNEVLGDTRHLRAPALRDLRPALRDLRPPIKLNPSKPATIILYDDII